MDFNKSPEGRFKSLAGERKNPFGSSRQPRNSPTDDNSSSGGSTNGKYVPPSKRNNNRRDNNRRDNDRRGNRRTEGMVLPDADDRRKAPTPPPDTNNEEQFPSLVTAAKIANMPVWNKPPQITRTQSNESTQSPLPDTPQEEPQVESDTESEEICHCCHIPITDLDTTNHTIVKKPNPVTKPSFASIAKEKEEAPSTPSEKEPLKPGWVRLFRGPNGEFMQEHGPPVPENPYFKQVKEYEERRARQQLIDTLERNIAYTREMDPYYEDYNSDQDDYEEDEEGMSDHEYVEEYESEDYSEDDYY